MGNDLWGLVSGARAFRVYGYCLCGSEFWGRNSALGYVTIKGHGRFLGSFEMGFDFFFIFLLFYNQKREGSKFFNTNFSIDDFCV